MSEKEKGIALIAVVVVIYLAIVVYRGMQPVSLADRSAPKASPSPAAIKDEEPKCETAAGRVWKLSLLYSDDKCTKPFGIVEDVDRPGVVVVSVFDEVEQKTTRVTFDREKLTRATYVKE